MRIYIVARKVGYGGEQPIDSVWANYSEAEDRWAELDAADECPIISWYDVQGSPPDAVAAIVRDIAQRGPMVRYQDDCCAYCGATGGVGATPPENPADHETNCLWRRACAAVSPTSPNLA